MYITRRNIIKSLSLFSGAGIGDLGFRAAGIHCVGMVEIDKKRSQLAKLNYPDTFHHAADITLAAKSLIEKYAGQDLFLISCSAPCQGMSSNGKGMINNSIKQGKRSAIDPRNSLILPAIEIILALHPQWAVFENVIGMKNTLIENAEGSQDYILKILEAKMSEKGYTGQVHEVNFANYGVPQRRKRLITVYCKKEVKGCFIPPPSHSDKTWVTLGKVLEGFPPLDAVNVTKAKCDTLPYHNVPVMKNKRYEWVKNTPEGQTAFDNQCINCPCQSNKKHVPNGDTPLFCSECTELLPRPYTEKSGEKQIMKAFRTAYKRMDSNVIAPTLTKEITNAGSDNKLHPTQNRTLSLAEAMVIQTISNYPYEWGNSPNSLVEDVIGESIPPLFLEKLGRHLIELSK